MNKMVQLQSADGFKFDAYLSLPVEPPKAAVVVLQEIFGVNAHIKEVADGFASQGYLAVAPSTFQRVKPNVNLGYTAEDMNEGFGLKTAVENLPEPGVLLDIQAAVDYAAAQSGKKVGLVGYCWGGLLTWRAAALAKSVSAAVPYYGGGITSETETLRLPKCPVLAHFGSKDHWIPLETVEKFQKAHPEVQIQIYEADHGFNCNHRGSFDAPSADLALKRTLAFFSANLL
jgi:carboxymethylenebutenolidase